MSSRAAIVALVGLAAMALAGSSSASSRRSSRRSSRVNTTSGYAQARLPYLRERWENATIRSAVERYAPLLMPGLPPVAALAFGVSSEGPTEHVGNTAWGLFGVERSRLVAWANDQLTREALRRPVDVSAIDADLEAQVYLGLRRYRVALEELRAAARAARLPVSWSTLSWSPWEFQSAVAGYSAGQGTTVAAFRGALVALSSPRSIRWTRIAEDLSPELKRRTRFNGRPVRGPRGIAWALVRPRERYEAARALASELHDARALAWCDSPPWPPTEDRELWQLAHARR